MSFKPFGPIELNKDASLNGWGAELRPDVTAIYGALKVKAPIKQVFSEPIPGLAVYLPDSGVTLASATGFGEQLRIQPGHAYFYSAEAGAYFGDMMEPGVYSGLKVFMNADAVSGLNTLAARHYRNDPSKPIFSEIPINKDLLARIANLPDASPSPLPDELKLLADLNRLVADVLSIWVGIEAGVDDTTPNSVDAQIEAADQYLKAHMDEPPSVISLANLVGLNHMTMKRGFRRFYGTTVYGRLRYWRMQRATELLETGVSVTDTALEVGYSNPSKFAAAYRRETGRSPSER